MSVNLQPKWTSKTVQAARTDYPICLETFVSFLYHTVVQQGDTVIDAGVNRGMHFVPLTACVGDTGRVIGFDANAELLSKVAADARARGRENFDLHAVAISDHRGTATFHVFPDNPGVSHLDCENPSTVAEGFDSRQITVTKAVIDDYVTSRVSFIKSDIEGADFLGLRGAENTILSGRPIIIFENGLSWAAENFNYSVDEFFTFFDKIRYRVIDVHGLPLEKSSWGSDELSGEFLAIPSEDPRVLEIFRLIDRFWWHVHKLPESVDWKVCARVGKDISELLANSAQPTPEIDVVLAERNVALAERDAIQRKLGYCFHNPWKTYVNKIGYNLRKSAAKLRLLPTKTRRRLERSAAKRRKKWLSAYGDAE